jgi:hypothetical protein
MRRARRISWVNTWLDAAATGAEMQWVIGLRLLKMARGGAAGVAESRRMFTEKVETCMAAQQRAARSVIAGKGNGVRGDVSRLYKRRVRSNLKRLAKGK